MGLSLKKEDPRAGGSPQSKISSQSMSSGPEVKGGVGILSNKVHSGSGTPMHEVYGFK